MNLQCIKEESNERRRRENRESVPLPPHALMEAGLARLVQRGIHDLLAAEADGGKARGTTPPDELKQFEHETERARLIAASHPRFWEYLLTEELMRSKLSAIEEKYNEFDSEFPFRPRKSMSPLEYVKWMPRKFEEAKVILQGVSIFQDEFAVAWGPLGQPGNALNIANCKQSHRHLYSHDQLGDRGRLGRCCFFGGGHTTRHPPWFYEGIHQRNEALSR